MSEKCPNCGLPKEICSCEDVAIEQQLVNVRTDRRKWGKMVTIIEGIDPSSVSLDDLASELKKKCAAGGTVKKGRIEVQGNHKKKVKKYLKDKGFQVSD